MTIRIVTIFCSLILGAFIPAIAQSPADAAPPAPQASTDAAPKIRDEGRYWSDSYKARMNKRIEDLFRRYRCRVIVETYPKEPNDWANGADLNDEAAEARAVAQVCQERYDEIRRQGQMYPVLVQIQGPVYQSHKIGLPNLSQDQNEEVRARINECIASNFTASTITVKNALPDVLTFIGEACEGRVAPPIGPAFAAFKEAATSGGLSGADLGAVLDVRESMSFRDLNDFARDQIKEGRKGKDLKDDLLTFIKLTQKPDEQPAPQSPAAAAPTIRDGCQFWSDADRARMNATIANVFRRYRCRIIIEVYPKEQIEWTDGEDQNDKETLYRAVKRMCDKRTQEARLEDPKGTNVVIICAANHQNWSVSLDNLSGDDRGKIAQRIGEYITDNVYFSWAVPDILTLISEGCQGRVARPIGSMVAAFKETARAGGLSDSDLEAVLNARGGIPHDDLTDFAKDQMKDGRKGRDLKDDLLTFIKLLKEKK